MDGFSKVKKMNKRYMRTLFHIHKNPDVEGQSHGVTVE